MPACVYWRPPADRRHDRAGHARRGWQVLTLHEAGGVEAFSGDGGGAGAGEGTPLRAEVLAHEIKNPLAGIRGAAQLLGRKLGDSDRALTELITGEVDGIAKLVDQMQSLSRRGQEPRVPSNLHEAVRRAQAVVTASRSGAFVVEEEFDPSLPPVMASPDALVQVLLNLLTNAREACQTQRTPRIAVRSRFASGIQLQCWPWWQTAASADRAARQRQWSGHRSIFARSHLRSVRNGQEERAGAGRSLLSRSWCAK